MASPAYPKALPVAQVATRLRDAVADARRKSGPDDVSPLDERVAETTRIRGSRQATDPCLLAPVVRRGGTFVTFDASVAADAVHGVAERHLTLLGRSGPGPPSRYLKVYRAPRLNCVPVAPEKA